MDSVDKIIAQWRRERPDLDVAAMALIGRVKRLSHEFTREMEATLASYGLNLPAFDVLATLRRSGRPFRLSPGELMERTMVTSGTMTNRVDQLEKQGLVVRVKNPDDARGFLVSLSPKGRRKIDAALAAHVETQKGLVSILSQNEFSKLNALLRRFLVSVEEKDHPENSN